MFHLQKADLIPAIARAVILIATLKIAIARMELGIAIPVPRIRSMIH